MEKVFYWQFPSYLNLFLSIYLTLFGHHHQSSMSGWCTEYIHIIGTKIAWKFFLSRNFPSHPWQTYNNYSSFKTFYFYTYSLFFWLCKNTSSCQLSAFSYQRETWSFLQFFKRKIQFFKQKFFRSIFSDFVGKRDSTLFV